MANRTYFILAYTGDPNADYDMDPHVVVAASYIIPALWFSAFCPDDLHWRTLDVDDAAGGSEDEPRSYPILLVTIQDIKQGSRGRPWKTLSSAARAGMPCWRRVER